MFLFYLHKNVFDKRKPRFFLFFCQKALVFEIYNSKWDQVIRVWKNFEKMVKISQTNLLLKIWSTSLNTRFFFLSVFIWLSFQHSDLIVFKLYYFDASIDYKKKEIYKLNFFYSCQFNNLFFFFLMCEVMASMWCIFILFCDSFSSSITSEDLQVLYLFIILLYLMRLLILWIIY